MTLVSAGVAHRLYLEPIGAQAPRLWVELMNVGEACTRSVVYIGEKESALEAARLMRRFHVGDVIIMHESEGRQVPMGIVTDRDLALEVLAAEVDAESVAAGDLVTSSRLITARIDEDLDAALQRMRDHGVRRLPVVDAEGALIGILSTDDALEFLAEELDDVVELVSRQRHREEQLR